MKKCYNIVVWSLLYVTFLACAIGVRQKMTSENLSEIWGWDYRTLVDQIQTWGYITYFGFRHPGLGLILSPLVVLEHLWGATYVVVMPGVALLTAMLLKRMSGWAGLVVWLSFPTTWLMAATPESFPVAQLALVVSVWRFRKRKVGLCGAGLLGVINGLITLTNGVKPVLAYLLTCRDWKKVVQIVGVIVGLAIAGVAFFYFRSLVSGRSCLAGLAMTLSWIPETRDIPHELYDFFIRPVGVYQSLVVYPLAVLGVVRMLAMRHFAILMICASYFSVDFLLHGVIGWGARELWVFAPHWLFILPLIVGYGIMPKSCMH